MNIDVSSFEFFCEFSIHLAITILISSIERTKSYFLKLKTIKFLTLERIEKDLFLKFKDKILQLVLFLSFFFGRKSFTILTISYYN